MENFLSLLIPVLALAGLLRLTVLPIRMGWKLLLNSGCGFLCLWLLNTVSGFTGLLFPVNAVTAAVAGFLGLPGIAVLGLLQALL